MRRKHAKAVVLVVVVYIVAMLNMLAFALAFRSRIAIKDTSLFLERLQQDNIAFAIGTQVRDMLITDENVGEFISKWHELAFTDLLSSWQASWRLVDESSKININIAPVDLLLGLKYLDEVTVASILDWIDQDDIPNPDGAEDSYYLNLQNPYNCKNAPIDNSDELLFIKGISPEIFYGSSFTEINENTKPSIGLKDLITVYGDSRININTAAKEVLGAIPMLSESAVSEIISRQGHADTKFKAMDDIQENENFTAADKLSLMQIARFTPSHFQLQIKIRKKERAVPNEYNAIIERGENNTRFLSWQRKYRPVYKNISNLALETGEPNYSAVLK